MKGRLTLAAVVVAALAWYAIGTAPAPTASTTLGHDHKTTEWDRIRMLVELDGCRRVLADGFAPLGPLTETHAEQLAFSMP